MPSDPATDLADLERLQRGDDRALDRLIERWQKPLVGFAFRYLRDATDARELTAETFVRLYQRRARLKLRSNLAAWLFTTLTNLCHNRNRWRRRHPSVALDVPAEGARDSVPPSAWLPSADAAPNLIVQQDELVAALQTAIADLPHDLRVTLLLHHFERLTYREIGAIVGCSEKGVETRLYRARRRLRARLGRFSDEL